MNYWQVLALLVLSVCDAGWCVMEPTASHLHVQEENLFAASDDVTPAAEMEEEHQQNISNVSADFSSDWAVQVDGGAEAADILASAEGFINMGQVRFAMLDVASRIIILCSYIICMYTCIASHIG